MERNQMMVQQFDNKAVIVPLLAKGGTYKFKVGKRNCEIPACVERFIIYLLYRGETKGQTRAQRREYEYLMDLSATVRSYIIGRATPIDINAVEKVFVEEHPVLEVLPKFRYEDVQAYAHPEHGIGIIDPYRGSWVFSREFELQLIDRIHRKKEILADILWYVEQYNMWLPKSETPYTYIVNMFLIQHGIIPDKYEFHSQGWLEGLGIIGVIGGIFLIGYLGIAVNPWFLLLYAVLGIPLYNMTNTVSKL